PSPVYDGYTTSLDVFLATGTSTPPPPPAPVGSCTASGANRTITVCSPASGGTVTSPVQFSAAVADTYTVKYMQLYVDYVKVYTVNAASLDTSLSMGLGTHRITIQAADDLGYI